MWLIIAIILLLIILPTFYFKDKLGMEVQGPFTLWKTKHGLNLLRKWSKHSNFWNWFADLGIIIAFGVFGFYYLVKEDKKILKHLINYGIFISMFVLIALPALAAKVSIPTFDIAVLFIFGAGPFLLYLLILQTWTIIYSYIIGVKATPGIAPILPGIDVPGSPLKVPLTAIVGMIILLFVHEISHGILAIVQKIKVKSLGILTAGIFPIGAFTEPDEEQLKKESMRKRMRVFSAGSMANFTTALVFFMLFILTTSFLSPYMQRMTDEAEIDYVMVGSVLPNSPAFFANITSGMKIYNANVLLFPEKSVPEVILQTNIGEIVLNRNEEGLIGLGSDYQVIYKNIHPLYWPTYTGLEIIYWTYLLNFLVGIFNFLPMYMLDGGFLFVDLTEFYLKMFKFKNTAKKAVRAFTYISIFIISMIVVNALPYFF